MNSPPLELQVFIDVICPWCYVGKRRMEKALATMKEARVRVTWLPFQLNPDMPKEGMERRLYRIRKFGSWEHSQRLDAQLAELGAQENIAFRYDRMLRTPNTLAAHRLIWFCRDRGQDGIVEALFAAYFTQGRDIGDIRTLAEVAADAGLERAPVQAFLAGGEGTREVSAQEDSAKRAGVTGVPAFLANGRPLFMGAQSPEIIADGLRKRLTSS
jgi:predicted DsbA family dithiol-disulfide isomerase